MICRNSEIDEVTVERVPSSTARWRTFVGGKRLFATEPLFFN
jgi:hypothetical protein